MQPPKKKASIYIPCTASNFIGIGGEIMKREPSGSALIFERRWMSFFAVRPISCEDVWRRLRIPASPSGEDAELNGASPKHLLWCLMWMRMYGSETALSTLAGGVDEGTFRKWTQLFATRISFLQHEVILWENRFKDDIGNDCLITVDGTDFRIPLQKWAKIFKSHKFGSSGLRYEVGICIRTGEIVWLMGPFPCGDWPDIEIFRYAMMHQLGDKERVEADDGYIGEDPRVIKVPKSVVHNQSDESLHMRACARLRQETCNKRFKIFKILKNVFQNDISLHGVVTRAIVVLTQLEINNGARLFDVDYEDLTRHLHN